MINQNLEFDYKIYLYLMSDTTRVKLPQVEQISKKKKSFHGSIFVFFYVLLC